MGFREAFNLTNDELRDARPYGTMQVADHDESRRDGERRLYPRPSSDPQDPLNWPFWLKIMSLLCMSLYGFVANYISASIASAIPLLATSAGFDPPVSTGKLAHLVSVNVLMLGAANIWWVPLAGTVGRRPILLLNSLLLTVFSIWAATAKSFNSLLAARLLMGVAGAPADTVAPNVIGEVFFVHQRGRSMALYTILLALGSIVGGISGGYIGGHLGIPWINWINAVLSGILFLSCLVFQPETNFKRDDLLATPDTDDRLRSGLKNNEGFSQEVENLASDLTPSRGFSYFRSLWSRVYHPGFFDKFFAPWYTVRFPGVWLVTFWYAGLVAGIVTVSTVGPTIMAMQPYFWGPNVGLINVGGAIGAILGLTMTVLLADRVIKFHENKSNNGFVEAEARLFIAIPGLFFATAGLWVFGFCSQYPSQNMWVGIEIGYGMLCFGLMQVPSVGFNYIIEAYGPVAPDCFVVIATIRAVISFCWTFFIGDWVTNAGPAIPFGVFGGLMGGFSLLVIPMLLWGKRLRIATEKWLIQTNQIATA